MRNGSIWMLVMTAAWLGCGTSSFPKDSTVTSTQQNSSPTGFIEGRVLSASDGTPVPGATVTSFADAPVATSSDDTGHYRLGPLPDGSYTVFVQGEGFLKSLFDADLTTASMFPVGNTIVTHDVNLSRPDASIAGLVLTSTGHVASGAALYLDLRPSGFELVASAKTDANGHFKFDGLPGSANGQYVTVNIAPWDENADGVADYASTSRSYALYPGSGTYNTISLQALGVQLVATNVEDGTLRPDAAVSLTFSGKIRPAGSTLTLFRNAGSVEVGTALSWDAMGTTATVQPLGGNLVEGQLYYLLYSVRAENGAVTNSSLSFTAQASSVQVPLGAVTNFRVLAPQGGAYDSGLTSVTLAWNQLANAGGYHLYGKDLASASAYLLLSNVGSGASTATTVSLSLFDAVGGDAFVTPLGFGNKITLAIVGTDRAGNEGALLSSLTLELADTVPPTGLSAFQQSGSANNLAGGAPATVVYQVYFSELMAIDTVPQITLPSAATSGVWAWQAANRGTFTITVPAGVDGRGAVSVTGGKDTSGNLQGVAFSGPPLF